MSTAPFFMAWSVTTTARDRRSDTIAARRINPETPENTVQPDRMRHRGCASGTQLTSCFLPSVGIQPRAVSVIVFTLCTEYFDIRDKSSWGWTFHKETLWWISTELRSSPCNCPAWEKSGKPFMLKFPTDPPRHRTAQVLLLMSVCDCLYTKPEAGLSCCRPFDLELSCSWRDPAGRVQDVAALLDDPADWFVEMSTTIWSPACGPVLGSWRNGYFPSASAVPSGVLCISGALWCH